MAEKNKLEKKAEELQWRLSAEAIMKQKMEEDNKKLAERALVHILLLISLSRSIFIFCICLFSLLFFSNFILQAAREEAKSKAAEFSSMSERLATLEAQVILLQKQLEREKTDKADKEKQLAKEHTETERLKKEVAEERGGKESETREKERAEKELEVEREEVKKLRAKNEELEAELKVANDRPKLSVCLRSVVS